MYLYGQIALVTLRVWVKPGVTGLSDPRSQATDVILCPESYYYPVSPYLTLSLLSAHYSTAFFPESINECTAFVFRISIPQYAHLKFFFFHTYRF